MIATVRVAKAKLSELIERAVQGEEVVVTSDGVPKVRIVAYQQPGTTFRVSWDLLDAGGRVLGTPAEVIVRQDRDERG